MAFQSGCKAKSWRPKTSSTVGALSGNLRLGDEHCDIKFHWILIPTARTFGSTGYQWDNFQPKLKVWVLQKKSNLLSKLQEYWELRCNHRLSRLYLVCLTKTWGANHGILCNRIGRQSTRCLYPRANDLWCYFGLRWGICGGQLLFWWLGCSWRCNPIFFWTSFILSPANGCLQFVPKNTNKGNPSFEVQTSSSDLYYISACKMYISANIGDNSFVEHCSWLVTCLVRSDHQLVIEASFSLE